MAVSCLIAKAHLRPPEVGDRGTDGEEEGSGRAGSTLSDADDGYVKLPMLVNYFLSLIFFSSHFSSIPQSVSFHLSPHCLSLTSVIIGVTQFLFQALSSLCPPQSS